MKTGEYRSPSAEDDWIEVSRQLHDMDSKMMQLSPTRKILLNTFNIPNWKTIVCFIAAFCFLAFGLSNQYVLHMTTIYGAYKILEYFVTQIIKDLS